MSASTRALSAAKRKLQMPHGRKQVVFEAAARAMGRACPTNKIDGYALLREFTGIHAQKTKPRVRPLAAQSQTPRLVPRKPKQIAAAATDDFLLTYEWRRLRMEVIKERGRRCECCGAIPQAGNDVVINVDHIKPRRKFPELALAKSNLQILCGTCNHGKGNWDETDWRELAARAEDDEFEPLWAPHVQRHQG